MTDTSNTTTQAQQGQGEDTQQAPATVKVGAWDHLVYLALVALTKGTKAPYNKEGATQGQVLAYLNSKEGATLATKVGASLPSNRQLNNTLWRLAPKGDNPQQGKGAYQDTPGEGLALITRDKVGSTWLHKVTNKVAPFPKLGA